MTNAGQSIPQTSSSFRRVWPVLKWLLFALVIVFVGRRAWLLWRDGDVGSVTIHWPWLLAACGLYGIGWLPSVFYWHQLIHGFGGTAAAGMSRMRSSRGIWANTFRARHRCC